MMWRRMDFCLVFASLFCSQLRVMSEAQTVLRIMEQVLNGRFKAGFDASMFTKFYRCLCHGSTSSCTARVGNDDKVIDVAEECADDFSSSQTYLCQTFVDIVCIQPGRSGKEDTCQPQNIENTKFCRIVTLEWAGNQQVEVISFSDDITVLETDVTHYISATYPVSPPLLVQTTRAPTPTPAITQLISSTTRHHDTTDTIAKDDEGNEDNTDTIIIIVTVVGVAVVVIAVTIIIIIWRRKQKASFSATNTNKGNHNSTDTIPYGKTSLTSGEENLPPPPPELSSKYTYYNTVHIIGEPHTQSVNENTITYMNTIDREERGQGPGHDRSGYEEIDFPQ